MIDVHAWTQERYPHTGGSISVEALDKIVGSVPAPRRVVEFGAGYSSLFLVQSYECEYIAVEHNPAYVAKLAPHAEAAGLYLIQIDLGIYDRDFVQELHRSDTPRLIYDAEIPHEVPEAERGRTGLRDAFYDARILDVLVPMPDLIIHDGPNGSGRSIAYPLLRDTAYGPFYIFVDDIQAFGFESRLRQHFEVEELWRIDAASKTCALFRAEARCKSE